MSSQTATPERPNRDRQCASRGGPADTQEFGTGRALPLVTVIVPTFNRASFLDETIGSILGQNYKNIELIVIDDGSTDDTASVLEKFRGRATILSHPNIGENATVNRGFELARGKFVCVVNSDDPLLPNAISTLVDVLESDDEALIAYGDWAAIGPRNEFLKRERLKPYTTRTMLTELNFGMGPGMVIRRSAIEAWGGRETRYRFAGDMEFCLRLSLHGRFVHVPELLATHRVHPDSALVCSRRTAIGREYADAFLATLRHPLLPDDLKRARLSFVAAMYDERRRAYSDSLRDRVVFGFMAFGCRLLAHVPQRTEVAAALRRGFARPVRAGIFAIFSAAIATAKLFVQPGREPATGPAASFAFSTRFLPPLWSGQSVVIARLLRGLDPALYRLIGQPVMTAGDGVDEFIDSLPGRYYRLDAVPHHPDRVADPQHHARLGRPRIVGLGATLGRHLHLVLGIVERAWQIHRALRHDRPRVLIGCTGDKLDPPATWLAARLLRSRACLYLFDDYVEQWWAEPDIKPAIALILRFIARRCDLLIAPNEMMREKIVANYGVACALVRNPMSSSTLPPAIEVFPSNGRIVRLVFTGAVYHLNYAVFRAISAAIEGLAAPRAELHLYTAQPGAVLEAEGLKGSHVHIHPHAKPEATVKAQCDADILLIPFNDDPRCNELVRTSATAKLADYLATGRPILAICTAESFLAWYLGRYRCGIVVHENDPGTIRTAVRRIIEDAALRKELARNGRARATIDFDPKETQKDLLSALERMR
jgi:glycosyltransferase involved in cell wall biosynthesis